MIRFRRRTMDVPQPRAMPQSSDPFNTNFPNTENPMSQGGIWTQGGDVGGLWKNIRTNGGTPGIAYGASINALTGAYDDCIATLQGRYNPQKHWALINVKLDVAYVPPSSNEIECLVGFTISASNAKGYEIDIANGGAIQPVRWNGASGDFDVAAVTTVSGSTFTVTDGDFVAVFFDSTSGTPTFYLYKNQLVTPNYICHDATGAGAILTGSPGLGFWNRDGTGIDLTKYCINGFQAGNW